jgi:hypothetical protein
MMFCPSCRVPVEPHVRQECPYCQADMKGLRERLAVGAQFVFADASLNRPIAISLDGEEPQVFTQPTIISRHRHGLGLGEAHTRFDRRRRTPDEPGVDLPRLPVPVGPDLTAVITERKIYRPKDEAHIFVIAPDASGEEIEMEVQLAGQQVTKDRLTLDEVGLALLPYADLEEGEYTVLVRRLGQEGRKPAECTFSVAEFTLSPLIALLERHTYEVGELSFSVRVLALSVPYSGPLELGLQSGARVVEIQQAEAHDGVIEASFAVSQHEGPFRLQITTPDGETATVFFPGTARTERERITLCPLGEVAEAGLLPGEDTQEIRGLHVGYGAVEVTPLRLESAVARTGRLVADVRAGAVQIVTFHPLTGATALYEFTGVAAGDAIEFPVEAPYTLFTVGVLAPRHAYEAWGVVVHPIELTATLSAPESAEPGQEIAIRVDVDHPASCLLLVYDARLEHESPLPKLGKQLIDAIRSDTGDLKEQTAPALAAMPPWAWGSPWDAEFALGPPVTRAGPVARGMAATLGESIAFMAAQMPLAEPAASPPGTAVATVPETLVFVAAPSREDFPELAYMELFTVRDLVERTVLLGDQIGTWRCRAYVVAGLDVVELTADVDATKAVYAELDLPAIVAAGDDILASVHYHTQQPATLVITLPDGQTISGAALGHAAETFHLTEPGDVTVHIASTEGEDWTTRTVKPPGVQTVTSSRLEILRRGETIQGERVVVYPGPADVLQDTIEALGRYPFG